jgi:hypothetical protein
MDAVEVARAFVNVLELVERGASTGGRVLDRVQVALHTWRLRSTRTFLDGLTGCAKPWRTAPLTVTLSTAGIFSA